MAIITIDKIAFLQPFLTNIYVHALLIFVGFFIGAKIVHIILKKYISKLAEKTATDVDDLIIQKTQGPITTFIVLYGLSLALKPLPLSEQYEGVIVKIIHTLLILIIFFVGIRVFDVLIDSWAHKIAARTRSVLDDALIPLLHKFSRVVFTIFAFLYILNFWGIEIGPLLAGIGIGGVAIAFALQSSLGNIFGGISLIMDKTVKVGDVIEVDKETSGRVIDVGLRSTKIKTWDNEVVIVPNGKLSDSKIKNLVLPDPRIRIVVKFGVEYGSDIEKVKKVVLDTVKKIDTVLNDPKPTVDFLEMADFSLNFRATIWVKTFADRWSAKLRATEAIYDALNKAKIGIPFPTRTVYLKEDGKGKGRKR